MKIELIKTEHTVRFRLKNGENYLSFREVFDLWQKEPAFIQFYVATLKDLGYEAFCWEHPALSKKYLDKRYECILQRSNLLENLAVNERAFSNYIHSKDDVKDFMNLGKDARLVIPTKKSDKEIYNHLGKFLRKAGEEQIIAVFKRVGEAVVEELERQETIWLNTAGLGVIWLHIRMDIRPKYYKTREYKKKDFLEAV